MEEKVITYEALMKEVASVTNKDWLNCGVRCYIEPVIPMDGVIRYFDAYIEGIDGYSRSQKGIAGYACALTDINNVIKSLDEKYKGYTAIEERNLWTTPAT